MFYSHLTFFPPLFLIESIAPECFHGKGGAKEMAELNSLFPDFIAGNRKRSGLPKLIQGRVPAPEPLPALGPSFVWPEGAAVAVTELLFLLVKREN